MSIFRRKSAMAARSAECHSAPRRSARRSPRARPGPAGLRTTRGRGSPVLEADGDHHHLGEGATPRHGCSSPRRSSWATTTPSPRPRAWARSSTTRPTPTTAVTTRTTRPPTLATLPRPVCSTARGRRTPTRPPRLPRTRGARGARRGRPPPRAPARPTTPTATSATSSGYTCTPQGRRRGRSSGGRLAFLGRHTIGPQ